MSYANSRPISFGFLSLRSLPKLAGDGRRGPFNKRDLRGQLRLEPDTVFYSFTGERLFCAFLLR